MGLFSRLRQLTGDEPLKRRHLGQFSHFTQFMDKEELHFKIPKRLNHDFYLNVFKTNSATLSIENVNGKQEFHLIEIPIKMLDKEVFKLMNKKGSKFLLAINSQRAMLNMNDTEIGTDYSNG